MYRINYIKCLFCNGIRIVKASDQEPLIKIKGFELFIVIVEILIVTFILRRKKV